MATADDTFDPNDLDSIDALLDEAELDAVENEPEVASLEDVDDVEGMDDPLDALLDEAEGGGGTDDLLDSLDDMVSEAAPEVVAVSKPASKVPEKEPEKVEGSISEADADEFLAKRAAARSDQTNQNTEITAADMSSIKKLIIIFGSILISLILTAIGIGVWGALAASSAGMDEETLTMIEGIKVSSEHNGSMLSDSDKTAKSIEKKLDALNFQLEQLSTDLAETSEQGVHKVEVLDPLGLGGHAPKDTHGAKDAHGTSHTPPKMAHGHQPAVVTKTHAVAVNNSPVSAVPAKTIITNDPAILKKVTSVNSKMIKAQRRIDEINRRVKNIQTQYQSLLQSFKRLEKQMLIQQVEKAKKAKEAQVEPKVNPYQYSAPEGVFYDQSVGDTYP